MSAAPKPPGLHYNCWRGYEDPTRWCLVEDRHVDKHCEGCALRGLPPGRKKDKKGKGGS